MDKNLSPIKEIDLTSIINSVTSRKYTIAIVMVMAMTFMAFFVSSITPTYRATSTLLIEQNKKKVVSIEQVYNLDGSGKEYLMTQFELLRSRSLAERVVNSLDIVNHPDFDIRLEKNRKSGVKWFLKKSISFISGTPIVYDKPSYDNAFTTAVNQVMGAIFVYPVAGTRLVKVSVELSNPIVATDIANFLVEAYIEGNLESRINMNRVATEWIDSQLSGLKQKLEESEHQLQLYRETENLVDLNGISTLSGDELSQLSLRQVDARRERALAESRYLQVERLKGSSWESYLDVPSILSNALVSNLKLEVGSSKIEYDSLAKRYGPKHPKLIDSKSKYQSALLNLKSQVLLLVSGIEKDYQLSVAAEESIDELIKNNNLKIRDIKRKEFKFLEYQREVDTNLALYDTFLTRLKETKVTSDLEEVNARVVDKAIVPGSPFKPKKTLMVLLSGVGAAVFMAAVFILIELSRNVIKKPEDVEAKIAISLMGSVPKLDTKNRDFSIASAFSVNEMPLFSEAIRTIRTSLLLSDMENENKVVLMTSSVSGEGKTIISSNLALSLGKMEKVILIYADMRKPASLSDNDPKVGLSDLILDRSRLSDAISNHSDIDVIFPGELPANPLELLSTERFSRIMEYLRSQYDRIIIDSPPVEIVSDSLVLSTLSDSVIYLVKADETVVPSIRAGISRLISNNATILGVVLNQVSVPEKSWIGYGKSRGYYGYGEY